MKNSKGTVLITVSIISMVIFMMMAFMLNSLTNEMRISMRSADAKKAEDIVQAGIEQGISFIKEHPYQNTALVIRNPYGYVNAYGKQVAHKLSWDVTYDGSTGKYNIHSVAQYGDKIKKQMNVSYLPEKDFEVKDYLDSSQMPLDSMSSNSTGAAFSLRKLRDGYTGYAIRVTTAGGFADIGFDAGGNLDTVALTNAATAGGYAKVSIWYNQGLNTSSNDLLQATDANRPLIVTGGSIISVNGRPAVKFDGTNDNLSITSPNVDWFNVNNRSWNAVFGQTTNGTTQSIIQVGTNAGISIYPLGGKEYLLYSGTTGAALIRDFIGKHNFQKQQITNVIDSAGNNVISSYNGEREMMYTNPGFVRTSGNILYLGSNSTPTYYYNGTISEIMILPRAISTTEMIKIEKNQSNYYNVNYATQNYYINPLVLDQANATVECAFSLRKVSSAYRGSAIKVRRSSDNLEKNIGFDTNGDFDKTLLLDFVGTGSGYVTKWYDQGPNGYNVTQSNTAIQPVIASAGSVIAKNGKPSIFADNGKYLESTIALTGYRASMLGVYSMETGTLAGAISIGVGITGNTNDYVTMMRNAASSNISVYRSHTDLGVASNTTLLGTTMGTLYCITGSWNGESQIAFRGTAFMELIGAPSLFRQFTATKMRINDTFNAIANSTQGYYSEVILWEDDKPARDLKVIRNEQNYYNTP